MKIWYQSLVDGGRVPAYFDGLAERARTIARPGVDVRFHSMPEGTYGPHTPAEVVIYPYLASLHEQTILEHALRAEAEGYAVFAIGSVQDPALEVARSLIDIPVVGYGESAMHFAGLLGSRFAVIVFGAGFDQMMDERIERLGFRDRAIPTLRMEASFADVTRGDEALVERFLATAREAIARGAEALIPGQLYLSEAIARAGVTRIDEVPIVDGLATTLKMAESMADLKRIGIAVTRRGYAHARPPRALLDYTRTLYGRK